MNHNKRSDADPVETKEWLDALSSLVHYEGEERAIFIIEQILKAAAEKGLALKSLATGSGEREQIALEAHAHKERAYPLTATPYVNTIAKENEPPYPGDLLLEAEIEAAIRWNAIAMVCRAKQKGGLGGHLSSFASIATLYEVGMNHFFRGRTATQLGDLIYFQGHSSEGNYARAFLEGRLSLAELNAFRQEVQQPGLSSYPHPWLMPEFWQFATVSLGLGMLQGVYQARLLKYLAHRELLPASTRKVWVFCGDGEMDEPESIAGLTLAAREKLDNLIFVVNCNLQRLDGLVRGNGKIIQELEQLFLGAKWNVIKVLWDSHWDALFAQDKTGVLAKRLATMVDGDLQHAYVGGPSITREFIFNSAELKALIADWSDEALSLLNRGAHDPIKIYAAYQQAVNHKEQPTVILTQSVKGYGLGTKTTEGRNIAHNQLELSADELTLFQNRFKLSAILDEQLNSYEFYSFAKESKAATYLQERRQVLGGFLPARITTNTPLSAPPLATFDALLKGSGERTLSTTMALARILSLLLKDKTIGKRIVPIFSDEVRTFGMETLFRQVGIYSSCGQLYTPEDKDQFLFYHEATDGQVLEEGITEAGCMASWIAAATSYATHDLPLLPIFTYYSMFGFQRVGDLIWAAADMRARGFLIGATAGRTTLEGEGLQHQDGTSLLSAANVPSCRAYDPAYAYEMAVIIQHGIDEMLTQQKDVFYYIMAMNERYLQPAMPTAPDLLQGIIKGMYRFQQCAAATHSAVGQHKVQLLGSGAILNEVIAAAQILEESFNVAADVWSVTSFAELRRDGAAIYRDNMLHPENPPRFTYVEECLDRTEGPIVAATDYVKAYADLIRPYLKRTYITLGTDGYGRSDTRENLRYFFEVNRHYIVVAALYALSQDGKIAASVVSKALQQFGLDGEKPNPLTI